MIFDETNLFSDDQAITASAASTNHIDLGATGTPPYGANALDRDIGKGTPIPIRVQVTEDFATLTSLTVAIQVDDNNSFSSPVTVMASQAIPVASLVAGYVFNMNYVPRGANERYLRLNYTVGGSNATAGAVIAGIVAANEEI